MGRNKSFVYFRSEPQRRVLLQFLWVAIDGAFGLFRVDDCVCVGKTFMVALRPSVTPPIAVMYIEKMLYDHLYDVAAVIVAMKTLEAVSWAAVLSFLAG